MDCSIYINEVSFTQSSDKDFCVEQVKEIIRMVEIFKSTFGLNYKILYHPNLYERGILPDGRMLSVLLKENPSLGQRFKSMIQKAKRWDRAMLQKPGKAYFCMGENCCMTSVAEAFEASTSEPCSVVLANALGSSFPEPAVDVYTEVKGEKKSLDSFKAYSTLVGHLIKVGHLINKYDKSNQSIKPVDEQTILADSTQFQQTIYFNKGERLYERIGYDELWCLDSLHSGSSAHCEVFDKNSKRLIWISDVNEIRKIRELTKDEKLRVCEMSKKRYSKKD